MRTDRKRAERMSSRVWSTAMLSLACASLGLTLGGCSHKQIKVHIPVASPVDLETVSMPDGELDPVPDPEVAPLAWPEPPKQPVRRRAPPREDAGVATQPATETSAPPELTIGALSTGGDATPQSQQQARDLIASVDRRISGLPVRVSEGQKPQLRKVRNFLDEAKKALDTGDTDGATNLANKAKVLMDELERR